MHPSTALHLSQLLTAGNLRAFPKVGVRGGEIFGIPVLTSVGAVCSGSPTERVIAAINTQGVLVADNGEIKISASRQAAVEMSDAPSTDAAAGTGAQIVSLFQVNSVAIRFSHWLNFSRSHDNAVSYMRVTY